MFPLSKNSSTFSVFNAKESCLIPIIFLFFFLKSLVITFVQISKLLSTIQLIKELLFKSCFMVLNEFTKFKKFFFFQCIKEG